MQQNYSNEMPPVPGRANNQPSNIPESPYMGFDDAVKICLNKYVDFSGRASRAEYWWFILFGVIVGIVMNCLGWLGTAGTVIGGLVNLAFFIPTLAVSWRRMHDIGKGGGWWFLNFIPLVGWIIWIVWCCQSSEQMPNRFGGVPAR